MAVIFPSIDKISQFKVQPTKGEWHILQFLTKVLDDSFEIYFNPYLNGDRPDIFIMRKGYGIMIVEVKDWNLNNFELNDKKKWVYKPNSSIVKSPVDQVLKYKNNLYDLHIDELLEHKIKDIRHFNIVTSVVYFHCATIEQINQLLVTPFEKDTKYQSFLKYNIDFIGNDTLTINEFQAILLKRYLLNDKESFLFTNNLYLNFKRILSPTLHMKSEGESYNYSPRQLGIIHSKNIEQRVKGVFGSGKTTVLAARAVEAYKRALLRNNNPKILILTYNITLKNFIHDKLMRVNETFVLESFIIINYHQFINAELNNLNIEFEIPENISGEELSYYLEKNYYSNLGLFEKNKNNIIKYDAVLIDEIQDFKRPWMDIIKQYFRSSQGDYVLFGDVKQNIYGNPINSKDVVTNVIGVNELKYCYRSEFKIQDLAIAFQKQIFQDKYEIDDITHMGFEFDDEKQGYINYIYLQEEQPIPALYNIIRGNIINKGSNIAPNDITILGYNVNILREFDCFYRYSSREKTNTMFETIEVMYMSHLNYFKTETTSSELPKWYGSITQQLHKRMYQNRKKLWDNDYIKIRQKVAQLFTIYDLHSKYSECFEHRLNEICESCKIPLLAFLAYMQHFKEDISEFRSKVYKGSYKVIRDNKKLHFWMNSGTIKISTINSFKGWEGEMIFLIVDTQFENTSRFNQTFDELLYTGLTRCRNKLVIINKGNVEYDIKIRKLVKSIT